MRVLMTRKSCTVGMRNAILRNYLKDIQSKFKHCSQLAIQLFEASIANYINSTSQNEKVTYNSLQVKQEKQKILTKLGLDVYN